MSVYGTVMATQSRGRALSSRSSGIPPSESTMSLQHPLITPFGSEEDGLDRAVAAAASIHRPPSTIDPVDRYAHAPPRASPPPSSSQPFASWMLPRSFDGQPTRRIGISPQNKYIQWFDYLLCACLVYTATVCVFVVCVAMTQPQKHHGDVNVPFVNHSSPHKHSNWSAAGRVVDLVLDAVFLADFVLGFFRAFRLDGGRGRLVYELSEIQQVYFAHPGFVMDLLSSIPFDVMVLVLHTVLGVSRHSVRFLRLIRLTRLHRAYRIIDQSVWYQAFTLRVDSKKLHMFQLVCGLLLVEHWASCWWVWLGREEVLLERARYTWIDRLEENGFIFDRQSELELYIVGLYWASTVSTSVGSGDVVPANPQEAMFVAVFQILGGCLFAYAVSSLVGLYTALHMLEASRGQAVDSVNEMLHELVQEDSRVDVHKIRQFVWQACDARAARSRRRLGPGGALSQLSPQLRDEVLFAERSKWMEMVWFLRHLRPRLARLVCREAKWVTYAPGDFVTLTSDQCVVLTRGVASTRNMVMVRGCVLGIAGLATVPKLGAGSKGPCFLCISFVEALMFDSAHVNRAIKQEGDEYEKKRLLRARVRYGLLGWASRVRKVMRREAESQELAYSLFRS